MNHSKYYILCFDILIVLWIRIFLKDYDSSILINNILLLLFRTTLCMTTLHMIVNVIIIHYICCRVVRSPISFCKLLFIYQYFSIITIVLTSLDPHMGTGGVLDMCLCFGCGISQSIEIIVFHPKA